MITSIDYHLFSYTSVGHVYLDNAELWWVEDDGRIHTINANSKKYKHDNFSESITHCHIETVNYAQPRGRVCHAKKEVTLITPDKYTPSSGRRVDRIVKQLIRKYDGYTIHILK